MILRENLSRLKNPIQFAKEPKTWNIWSSDIKVSYDVLNLYTTVPTMETGTITLGMLAQDETLQTKTNPTIEEINNLTAI